MFEHGFASKLIGGREVKMFDISHYTFTHAKDWFYISIRLFVIFFFFPLSLVFKWKFDNVNFDLISASSFHDS